jgi:hypothetical protein
MVCSCTLVSAWNKLTHKPMTSPTINTGPASKIVVHKRSRASSVIWKSI